VARRWSKPGKGGKKLSIPHAAAERRRINIKESTLRNEKEKNLQEGINRPSGKWGDASSIQRQPQKRSLPPADRGVLTYTKEKKGTREKSGNNLESIP